MVAFDPLAFDIGAFDAFAVAIDYDTLSTINSATGVDIRIVVAIEGYPKLLTDATAAQAIAAWSGSDWTAALGDCLEVDWSLSQRLHPWEPLNSSDSSVTLKIMDSSGTNADEFGLAVFKREGMNASQLYEDSVPGGTSIRVKRSSAFAASGNLYVGCETVGYTANDNATNPGTFSTLTRGKYSPFKTDTGGRFQRTHRANPVVAGLEGDAQAGTSSLVTDAPLDWRGRWVGVWIHANRGGTLDALAEAHLAFAGRISSVSDGADGKTIVQVDEVRQVIGDAVILREQWRAKIKEGITLVTGQRFALEEWRQYITGGATVHLENGEANPLIVVAAGAAGANQINAGYYDGAAIASKMNEWMAAELVATRLLFKHTFTHLAEEPNGLGKRSSLAITDSVSNDGERNIALTSPDATLRAFFGWNDDGITFTVVPDHGTGYSANEPQSAAFNLMNGTTSIQIEDVRGSFANQAALMDQGPTFLTTPIGFVKIGNMYLPCEAPAVSAGVGTLLVGEPFNTAIGGEPADRTIEISQGGEITIEQVLILQSSFAGILLSLLASTGGTRVNWAQHDVLPESCSAAIPYDLMTSSLEDEINAAPQGLDLMTRIVEKPTTLVDVIGDAMTLRLLQFVWRQGRLALRGYATPTSAATLQIAADSRATPIDVQDDLLAVTVERDDLMRNVVKIKHNYDATGEKARDTITITDPGSASSFGARILTINARSSVLGSGNAGENVEDLIAPFIAGLIFLSRPQMIVRAPLDHTMIEQATPGEVCLFSDPFARDPATGRRGLTNKPALIVAQSASWGGLNEPPRCEVDLMLFPRLSLAAYCPTAQVDDTAATGGYVAGTKVLTCYAHEHSKTTDQADATLFVTGNKVRVIQIDPATAAAPLTWDDIVAAQSGNTITLTTGLAGWDATKRYRVYSDDYADATTTQRANAYQADDADGQVADLREPYGMLYTPTGQLNAFTLSAATELAERPPDSSFGDGRPLDTGHARAVARGVNNRISYGTAPQQPANVASTELMTYSGAATWQLVWCEQVYIGVGTTSSQWSRLFYIAPTVKKVGGASANIRVTLASRRPRSADPNARSRDDMVRVGPYTSTTFNTTAVVLDTPTAVGLAIDHLQLAPGHAGGGDAWLYVELGVNASFAGFGAKYLGPLANL